VSSVVDLAIRQAQARLEMQFSNTDALDVKALGVLAADAAALGVLVATHSSLNPLWWIPCAGLAVAALLLLMSVRPRKLDQGPDIREFFERFGGEDYEAAALQMLGELLAAVERNQAHMPKERKARLFRKELKITSFKLGFQILVVSVVGAFLVGLIR
jgi:hypothetical protein